MRPKTLLFCLLTFACPSAQAQKRWFPAESARWVWSPYLNPALVFPRYPHQVGDPGFRFGLHALYYSPVLRLAPALKADFAEISLTRYGAQPLRYVSREVTVVPHLNWKFRRPYFSRQWHLSLDWGVAATFAVQQEKQTVNGIFPGEGELRGLRFYGYAGLHVAKDVTNAPKMRNRKSPRVGMHFADVSVLLPIYLLGNYYRRSDSLGVLMAFLPAFSIGQAIDLRRNEKNYESQVGQETRWKLPMQVTPPKKHRFYGGMFFEVLTQRPFSTVLHLTDSMPPTAAPTSVRLAYANSVGYSLHWGNYKLPSYQLGEKDWRGGATASVAVTFRRYTSQGTEWRAHQYQTADAYLGLRAAVVRTVFVTGGACVSWPFGRIDFLADGSEAEPVFPRKNRLQYGWYGSISYRHWLYLRIRPSQFLPYFLPDFKKNGPTEQRYEFSLGVGF